MPTWEGTGCPGEEGGAHLMYAYQMHRRYYFRCGRCQYERYGGIVPPDKVGDSRKILGCSIAGGTVTNFYETDTPKIVYVQMKMRLI